MFDDAAPTAAHAVQDFVETDLSTLIPVNEQARHVAIGRALHTGGKNSEQRLIQAALETTGTRNDAARKLGISPRTLRYKLAKLKGTTPELATSLEG